MSNTRQTLIFVLLTVAQILIWSYLNLSQYMVLTFLPAMILCLPIRFSPARAMTVAFVTGLAVDFFAQGVLGLTALALVPVAFSRGFIIRLVFGNEVYSRGENISVRRQGTPKMALGILMASGVFLLLYIWADGAGTRPLWFNSLRFFLSLTTSTLVSTYLAGRVFTEEDTRWN